MPRYSHPKPKCQHPKCKRRTGLGQLRDMGLYCRSHHVMAYQHARRKLRVEAGLCRECGKSREGSQHSSRCVDCGWKKKNLGIDQEKLKQLLSSQNNQCNYCGEVLPWDSIGKVHLDHIVPKSRGGADSLENRQFLCKACNVAKNNMTEEEFMVWVIRVSNGLRKWGDETV